MAVMIILQDADGNQLEKTEMPTEITSGNWEEQYYRISCMLISKICTIALSNAEERLYQ